MKTDVVRLDHTGNGIEKVFKVVENAATDFMLDEHVSRQLRLLAEETVEMMRNITGEFSADFCLDITSSRCQLRFKMITAVDPEKKELILSVASADNEHVTVTDRIRLFLESGYDNIEKQSERFGRFGVMKEKDAGDGQDGDAYVWSLQSYTMSAFDAESAGTDKQTWAQIGQSIIANLADDIRIYFYKDSVELTVIKEFEEKQEREGYAISPEFDGLKKVPVASSRFQVRMVQLLYSPLFKKQKSDDLVSVKRVQIPSGSSGGGYLSALIFSDTDLRDDEAAPCVLLLHGGAFVFPAMPYHYRMARIFAGRAGCRVIMPDYDLAPDHVPPIQMEQCFDVYKYILKEAGSLGIDIERIAVAGDSAGGTLSAALCIMAGERSVRLPAGVLLFYPSLDTRRNTPSMKKYVDVPIVNARAIEDYYKLCDFDNYKGNRFYNSPVECDDLKGFPPAYIEVAEFDALHDDGVAFADRLAKAGCDVVFNDTKGTVHAYDMAKNSSILRDSFRSRVGFLRDIFKLVD